MVYRCRQSLVGFEIADTLDLYHKAYVEELHFYKSVRPRCACNAELMSCRVSPLILAMMTDFFGSLAKDSEGCSNRAVGGLATIEAAALIRLRQAQRTLLSTHDSTHMMFVR